MTSATSTSTTFSFCLTDLLFPRYLGQATHQRRTFGIAALLHWVFPVTQPTASKHRRNSYNTTTISHWQHQVQTAVQGISEISTNQNKVNSDYQHSRYSSVCATWPSCQQPSAHEQPPPVSDCPATRHQQPASSHQEISFLSWKTTNSSDSRLQYVQLCIQLCTLYIMYNMTWASWY